MNNILFIISGILMIAACRKNEKDLGLLVIASALFSIAGMLG